MRLLLQLCFRHGPPPSAQDQTSFAGRPPPESAVSQDLWLSYTGSCSSWDSPFAIFCLFDGWFKMALLRYSSHSIEFNHFNCTFHIFFFCIFTKSCNYHHSQLRDISVMLNRNPVPLTDYCIVSYVSSGLRQPLSYSLSLQTCLFCSCHLNRIMCGFFFFFFW